MCTSRICSLAVISFRCGKVQSALTYLYLGLCNVYFTYLQSCRDLFPLRKSATCAHISLSRSLQYSPICSCRDLFPLRKSLRCSAMCTSRICSLAVISFRCGKLQPALIYLYLGLCCGKVQPARSYISISVSAMCTSRICSLAVISFRCGKVQPALIYLYLVLCNVYFTYLQSCRDLFPLRKSATCAHISLSQSMQCVLHVSAVLP